MSRAREGVKLNPVDNSDKACFDALGDVSLEVGQGKGSSTHNPNLSHHIAGSNLANQIVECHQQISSVEGEFHA